MNDSRLGSQRPSLLYEPKGASDWSWSDIAVEWAAHVGYVLDDWQRWLVRWSFARRDDGLWAARDLGAEVSRQNGKNIWLEVVQLASILWFGDRLIRHTAHRVETSHEHFVSLMDRIQSTPELMEEMPKRANNGFVKSHGFESIEFANGGRLQFKARQNSTGRGPRPSKVFFDEALILDDVKLGSMTPGVSAQPNPQLIYASSPPMADSFVQHRLRRRAEAAVDGDRFFYAAWNNPQDTDPDDVDAWFAVNPSLGYGRLTVESLRANRQTMDPRFFLREHAGVPEEPDDEEGRPIDPDRWRLLIDANQDPPEQDPTLRLAIDAPPNRATATFAIAYKRPDGLTQVQTRFHVPPAQMSDTMRLAKKLCDGHRTSLIIPSNSPALSWRTELEAAGVPLDVMTPADTAAAFGHLLVAVSEGTLRHRGQPELDTAVAGLAVKSSGDVDQPTRRKSSTNIAPFIAAMCALYRVPEVKPAEFFAGAWR